MRNLFYRLSWDEDFVNKVIKVLAITVIALLIILPITFISISSCSSASVEEEFYGDPDGKQEENNGDLFNLVFGKKQENQENKDENKDESKNENNNQNSDQQNQNNNPGGESSSGGSSSGGGSAGGGGSSSGGGSSGGGSTTHVHSWHTVVDQEAWTEVKQVQVGTQYICNNCGYSCRDAVSMNSHVRSTGHSYRTTPIYEQREYYHPGSSHQECSGCGARR